MTTYYAYFVLGQFLGVTSLVEAGLITPEQFVQDCIRIAAEYKKEKEKQS